MAETSPPSGIETRIPLEDLISGLSDATAFGEQGAVQVVQTHASVVFLTAQHAWKVKKPVRLWGLVDYGTFERRRHMCEEEVRLNRRLAPEVYLEVVPIVRRRGRLVVGGKGRPLEHAVKMVRMSEGASLLERVLAGTGGIEDEVARVGESLADFHAAHRLRGDAARAVPPSRFARVLRQNFRGTREAVPGTFPAAVHDGLRRRVARRLLASRGILRRRAAEGRMVEGHGDVRLEHVVRFRGRIAILDCIEFHDSLRLIDPLSDVAFLAMDFDAHGRPDLAEVFSAAYLQHAPDPDARTLSPLYRAYRAHVRAKVDEQTARDAAVPEDLRRERALSARRHLALAWSYARAGEMPPVVLLRGLSGSGKSVLADQIAPFLRADVIRSDVVRRELAGLGPRDRTPPERKAEVYGPVLSKRTYEVLRDRAVSALEAGRAVLLDATYLHQASRLEIQARALSLGAPYVVVDVRCPQDRIRERLVHRAAAAADPSEADWEVYQAQVREAEPFAPEETAHVEAYEAGEEAALLLMRLLERFERQGGGESNPKG